MPIYRKCPRCELNYILHEKDYCDVCLLELKGVDIHATDDEDSLCPECHEAFLEAGQLICAACTAKATGAKSKVDEEDDEPDNRLAAMTEEEDWEGESEANFEENSAIDDDDSFEDITDFDDEDGFHEVSEFDDDIEDEDSSNNNIADQDDLDVMNVLDALDEDLDEDDLEMDLDDLGDELGLDDEDFE